ncbi:MAG: hypothetical protein RL330_93 [Actinomycetota bacterium]
MTDRDDDIASLAEWLDACPTPVHVVERAAADLTTAGFVSAGTMDGDIPAAGFLRRDGSIIAWRVGTSSGAHRIVGAHTDSPDLRVTPVPDITGPGWSQLGIEIYGGVLLNSWLDRDLGIAGRIIDAAGDQVLFRSAEPVARIPQLAIHLDREVNEKGLLLDRQRHMVPVWGTRTASFREWLSDLTGVRDIAAWDAHLFDVQPARVLGSDRSLFAGARLDNQVSCWAGVRAIAGSASGDNTLVVVLNDHEEVGSESTTGAAGPLLQHLLEVIDDRHGLGVAARHDRAARSWCLSADNAHAVHPNYPERHEPSHAPLPNAGPALKLNGNQRYATSPRGAARLRTIAASAGVPLQTFVSRNNMPCGSTIGPITATRLGIEAIDIGIPQLSMHSAREMCGAEDPGHLRRLAAAFLAS